ncbi:MAG TPA: hypothetical protein VGO58_09085 [Chitinophagaceae bacterium]|jgi:hypothetical protein|nr:hypothetical protein [Chitinophagaceae bacterium]
MRTIFAILTTACIVSCNNSATDTKEIAKEPTAPTRKEIIFDRLLGTWQNEDGKSFERWIKINEQYQTTGFSVKGTDTSWNEQGKVFPENGNWIFENIVNGQNEGKAVRFTSTILNENTVQFSNPAHDFPTDINYTLAGPATIRAFIFGPNGEGGKDTIPFNFTRLK